MDKTVKLQSKFLTSLNESLQKLATEGKITLLKAPIMEADGTFSSVVQTKNDFDTTSLNSNVIFNDEQTETEEQKLDKSKLSAQAADKIKQTLQVTDELQSILNQIKKINDDTDYNDWKLNEKGNTATLRSKNAQIFKQNGNLCLSYNNKIEIFKSIKELHNWLREHNFPLPKNIVLHESAWDKILKNKATSGGLKIGDTVQIDPEEAKQRAEKFFKPIRKMNREETKYAQQFWSEKEKDPLKWKKKVIKGLPDDDNLDESTDYWYLEYQDKNTDNLYLNNNWVYGNLLTNNLSEAATFVSRDEAMLELDNVYLVHNTEAPFKPIQLSLDECFGGGTTSASVGLATSYLGSKDKKENTEEIKEGMYGFEGTPFEKKYYNDKYARAAEYLKWINAQDEQGRYGIDPNREKNLEIANRDVSEKQYGDRGSKHWMGRQIRKDEPHPMFRDFSFSPEGQPLYKGVLDKEAFIQRVKEINEEFGLNLNPDEPVFSQKSKTPGVPDVKISPHNKKEREKWIRNWFIPEFQKRDVKGLKAKSQQNIKAYEQNKDINTELQRLIDLQNNSDIDSIGLFDQIIANKDKLSGEEYNILVDKILDAGEKGEMDIDSYLNAFLTRTKVQPKKESAIKKEIMDNLKQRYQNITLTEDDTPADFATGSTDQTISSNVDSSMDSSGVSTTTSDTPDIDLDTGGETSAPGASFGDLNVNMGGDYGPDEEEGEEPTIPEVDMPDYKIIDVLANDEDDSDIRVKLQNMDTGETEIRPLSEIDI